MRHEKIVAPSDFISPERLSIRFYSRASSPTSTTIRLDPTFTRWTRGFSKRLAFNSWNVIFCLGSPATAVLAIHSAAKVSMMLIRRKGRHLHSGVEPLLLEPDWAPGIDPLLHPAQ